MAETVQDGSLQAGRDGFGWLFIDPRGRVGRAGFFVGMMMVLVLWWVLRVVVSWSIVWKVGEVLSQKWVQWEDVRMVVPVAVDVVALYCAAALTIRRSHDFDWRGWWVWMVVVPWVYVSMKPMFDMRGWEEPEYIEAIVLTFVMGWAMLWLWWVIVMLVPGSSGVNRFGAPRVARRWEVWAAWVLGVVWAGFFLYSFGLL